MAVHRFSEADQTGGTAPYTYAWSTGSTTDTIANLLAGMYFLTVTDDNGCTGIDSGVEITEPAVDHEGVDSTADASCNEMTEPLQQLSLGELHLTHPYLWSNGALTANISGLTAGSYTITVTDANGCTTAINPIVQQPAVLTSSIFISEH